MIDGGTGSDIINAGTGSHNTIYGGSAGNNKISGSSGGYDTIYGGGAGDLIVAGGGYNTIHGSGGSVVGAVTNNVITGGPLGYNEIFGGGDSYKQYIPEYLRNRPINDGLVAQALEQWASAKAATIMVGIFLVAAMVTLIALVPALMLQVRSGHGRAAGTAETGEDEYGEIAF